MNLSTEKAQLCCQLKAHLRFDKVFAYIFCWYYPIYYVVCVLWRCEPIEGITHLFLNYANWLHQPIQFAVYYIQHVIRDAGTSIGQRGQKKSWGQWKLMKNKKSLPIISP